MHVKTAIWADEKWQPCLLITLYLHSQDHKHSLNIEHITSCAVINMGTIYLSVRKLVNCIYADAIMLVLPTAKQYQFCI